ncbi:MAG TPA: PPC domain-containing protein [Longimicrobiales bacterium]|nr:PPC domain-containing protein [Longimicrobiales bacterium]
MSLRAPRPPAPWVAALAAALLLAGCGEDGPTGPEPDVPVAEVPFAAGKTWTYETEWIRTLGGVQTTRFEGRTTLHVEGPLRWQGRDAWSVARYDVATAQGSQPFAASASILSQTEDGLDIWVPGASGGEWRRILSRTERTFEGNHLLLAGDPIGTTTELVASSTTVPAGSWETVLARVRLEQSDPALDAVVEQREEYYADGVGPVRATWSLDFDDRDSGASDVVEHGSMVLIAIDADPSPAVVAEKETNDGGTPELAQAMDVPVIVSGRAGTADPGQVVDVDEVHANADGVRRLQDWYRFVWTEEGFFRLDLVHEEGVGPEPHDLDVYLFREEAGGSLTYVDDSSNPGPQAEAIVPALPLPAGTYYVAVQAWNTVGGDAAYWFSIR